MRPRLRGPFALTLALAMLAGCGGGGATSGASVGTSCTGGATNVICLDGCSLGCRGTTCELTEIAQNENIVLRFSKAIDPRFATEATIQFRTASGEVPVGNFLVNSQVVEFVPRILTIGSQSFFGFKAGETYTMTLPGGIGEPNAIRSTAGDVLGETVSCTLRVTGGIVDLNGVAPSARLLAPTVTANVAQDAVLQLGFNEMIDATPFVNSTTGNPPVAFEVARSTDVGGGVRVCAQQYIPLAGRTELRMLPELPNGIGAALTFTPTSPLPGSSCIRITVTDQVKDLSGRAAEIQTFLLQTLVTTSVEQSVTETFDDDLHLDADRSAGTWSGGRATFAAIGGDGRHGVFDPTDVALQGPLVAVSSSTAGVTTYILDTDSAVVPASRTTSGNQFVVNDGRFFFAEMVIPANARLVFIGNNVPQFTVRGRIQIDGMIDVRGTGTAYPTATSPPTGTSPSSPLFAGQVGGAGGIFAGNGGDGGRRCTGAGAAGNENGANGQDCRVAAGHAFAGAVAATGGRGATMFPAHGQTTQLTWPPTAPTVAYSMEAAAGGGGGGFAAPGGVGQVISNSPNNPALMGPPSAGGVALPILPVPAGRRSSDHFLIGGSGGGGGASQPSLVLQSIAAGRPWSFGCGGGGGGGVVSLRSGRVIRIPATGRILASGGSAGVSGAAASAFAQNGPAGGGSGGSILLQCADSVQLLGEINVLGGRAGVLNQLAPSSSPPPYGGRLDTEGGAGAPGFIRLERVGVALGDLASAQPAAAASNVGSLTESDTRVGFQSLYYSTGQPFGPEYVRYEIRATIDGQPVVFSDDPAVGIPARAGFGPLEAFWQGAQMDLTTGAIDPFDARPWRSFVGGASGLGLDSRNAFRFQLILDRTNGQVVEIDSVKVIYRV